MMQKNYERLLVKFNDTEEKDGSLQVWWIPQVPMKPFRVRVADLEQAAFLLDILAAYDFFQYEENVKGDFCNAGGVNVFEEGEWMTWYDKETGEDFDEWRDNNANPPPVTE
jgi:Superinfection exclusion gene product 17